jgi:hypothetical protein
MLWIFERGDEVIRFETRYDNETKEYVLATYGSDGTHQVERYREVTAFQRRLDALEKQLETDHWHAVGSPTVLRDGWKI